MHILYLIGTFIRVKPRLILCVSVAEAMEKERTGLSRGA